MSDVVLNEPLIQEAINEIVEFMPVEHQTVSNPEAKKPTKNEVAFWMTRMKFKEILNKQEMERVNAESARLAHLNRLITRLERSKRKKRKAR
jgi:hypothetical protein